MGRSRAIRDRVLGRDGRCCVCGRMEGLDVHHIRTWAATGRDNMDEMVTLCRVCHSHWHAGDQKVRHRVKEYMASLGRETRPVFDVIE